METRLYAVHDDAVKQYGAHHFARTPQEATRQFAQAVNKGQEGNLWHDHPEQFALYELATVDLDTGIVKAHPGPRHVVTASSIKMGPQATQ